MARKLIVEIIGDASSLERSFSKARRSTNQFERDSNKAFRGVIAGSGAFRGLGRSIAFASGSFLGFASVTAVLKETIDQATQAAATQRQLAATFKATGTPLADYQARIDAATNSLSRLAGIEDDRLKRAFTTAFRSTRNVSQSLRIMAIAADVAAARHIKLEQATIAVTKGVTQNATALKRLGIGIPANVKGFALLTNLQRRFAGQARAGATAMDRLHAAILNTEEILGKALLPAVNQIANALSLWLSKSKNQKRLQDDVTLAIKDTTAAVKLLGDAFQVAAKFADVYRNVLGKFDKLPGPLKVVAKVLFAPGFGLNALANALGGKQHTVNAPPGLAGPVGSTGGGAGLLPGLTGPVGAAGGSVSSGPNAATLAFQNLFKVVRKTIHDVPSDIAKTAAAADAARQKIAALRLNFANARQAFHDAFQTALDDARGTIGQLFAGPVLQPSADALKARLGVRIAGTRVGSLTSDLNAQTAQATQFFKDLARLRSRGGSAQLVDELRQGGDIAQAHALAGASPAALRAFLKAFQARERLASRVAIQTPAVRIAAQHVTLAGRRLGAATGTNVYVYVDGQRVPATVKTTQRRGRHAGTRG